MKAIQRLSSFHCSLPGQEPSPTHTHSLLATRCEVSFTTLGWQLLRFSLPSHSFVSFHSLKKKEKKRNENESLRESYKRRRANNGLNGRQTTICGRFAVCVWLRKNET